MNQQPAPQDAERPPEQVKAVASPPALDSEKLFGGSNEVRLRHRGVEYRLRITRQGKLILTK